MYDLGSSVRSFLDGKDFKKVANNTYAVVAHDNEGAPVYGVQYHKTVVFCDRGDGLYQFDTGGWDTATTKKRLNEILDWMGISSRVHTKRGVMYFGDTIMDRWLVFDGDGNVRNNSPFFVFPNVEVCKKADKYRSRYA
jgi:hypothetical protein